MATRRDTWLAVLAALVVAVGLAVVWGVVGNWGASLVRSLVFSDDRVSEDIYVAADGTPVIAVQSDALLNTVTLSRRTLDGKAWPLTYEYWLQGAYLQPRRKPPGLVQLPLEWSGYGERIIGGTDGRHPPAAWYVVRDDQSDARCYLAGFDAFSKLPVGYIARNGFRVTAPARDELFVLPQTNERYLNPAVASSQYFSAGVVWNHYLSEDHGEPAAWLAFLLEGDRMWEIDLRERTARVALEMPGLISVNPFRVLKSTVDSLQADPEAASRRTTPFRLAAAYGQELYHISVLPRAADEQNKPAFAGAIAIRTDNTILMYHSPSGNKREFPFPDEVPDESLQAYWIAPDQLLLQYSEGHWSGGPIVHLMWIDAAGNIQRKEKVQLAGWVPESHRTKAWRACLLMPISALWLVGMLLGVPLYFIQINSAADYASALAMVGGIAWAPLVIVLAVSAVFAWLTWRLQRKYRRPATGLWATFAFLLGLPGFVAYWLEHRRPKLETCTECGQIVPRDRDACADCKTSFPAPPPVGTEIFA